MKLRATFQIEINGECIEYKTPKLSYGDGAGNGSSILFFHRFTDVNGKKGSRRVYVEVIEN